MTYNNNNDILIYILTNGERVHRSRGGTPIKLGVSSFLFCRLGIEIMERIKNVYRILIETESGNKEILVFSHTHDNAVKKARVYFERKGVIIKDIVNAEKIHDNVIY